MTILAVNIRATRVSPLQPLVVKPRPLVLRTPSVRIPDVDHRAQDVVPGLWLQHGAIGEHTAVPADVLISPRRLAGLIAHPEPGVVDDIEPPVRVVHRAVAAGLIVRARAKNRAVVLGHVEIDRPGTERGGE